MICPRCGSTLRDHDSFCQECGFRMKDSNRKILYCRECGSQLAAGALFCSKCGKSSQLPEVDGVQLNDVQIQSPGQSDTNINRQTEVSDNSDQPHSHEDINKSSESDKKSKTRIRTYLIFLILIVFSATGIYIYHRGYKLQDVAKSIYSFAASQVENIRSALFTSDQQSGEPTNNPDLTTQVVVTASPLSSPTPTQTVSPSPTPEIKITVSPTPSPTVAPTPTSTNTPLATLTPTPRPTPTLTPSPSPSPFIEDEPTPEATQRKGIFSISSTMITATPSGSTTATPIPSPSSTPTILATATPAPTVAPTKKANSVYYSTNSSSTVKNGNTGIYAYVDDGINYDIYWIINFDEGYVYYFTEGNGSTSAERVKIVSGDLNDVLIITYHDGKDEWSYGLHFNWRRQPDHLIMQDERGFTYDYYPTNLEKALTLLETKRIVDY